MYQLIEINNQFAFVSVKGIENGNDYSGLNNYETWSSWHESIQEVLYETFVVRNDESRFPSTEEIRHFKLPVLKLTMAEIAKQFDYPVDKIKIIQ